VVTHGDAIDGFMCGLYRLSIGVVSRWDSQAAFQDYLHRIAEDLRRMASSQDAAADDDVVVALPRMASSRDAPADDDVVAVQHRLVDLGVICAISTAKEFRRGLSGGGHRRFENLLRALALVHTFEPTVHHAHSYIRMLLCNLLEHADALTTVDEKVRVLHSVGVLDDAAFSVVSQLDMSGGRGIDQMLVADRDDFFRILRQAVRFARPPLLTAHLRLLLHCFLAPSVTNVLEHLQHLCAESVIGPADVSLIAELPDSQLLVVAPDQAREVGVLLRGMFAVLGREGAERAASLRLVLLRVVLAITPDRASRAALVHSLSTGVLFWRTDDLPFDDDLLLRPVRDVLAMEFAELIRRHANDDLGTVGDLRMQLLRRRDVKEALTLQREELGSVLDALPDEGLRYEVVHQWWSSRVLSADRAAPASCVTLTARPPPYAAHQPR
jgi:hypothetical protein